MNDFISLNSVSQKSHRIVRSLISRTNLLTSNFPYAKQIMEIFKDVQIEPQPQKIRLLMYAKTEKDSIEIHFRDSQHLRKIVEEMPLIDASGKLYFVKDSDIQDGQELIAPEDGLPRSRLPRMTPSDLSSQGASSDVGVQGLIHDRYISPFHTLINILKRY